MVSLMFYPRHLRRPNVKLTISPPHYFTFFKAASSTVSRPARKSRTVG